jgi:hypothetical protein
VAELADCLRQAIMGADLPSMGKRSLEIINRWDYHADLIGLRAALAAVCAGQKHAHG